MVCVYGCVNLLVCVCACCAAFEATRFYNVSESSPLARELCDGPTCNEVESSTNHWIGETYSLLSNNTKMPHFLLSLKTFRFLQVLCRQTSATMCLAVWRRSSLSVAHATGTVVMMGNQFVDQTDRFTRTNVKWRCLLVGMGRASSRFHCPNVLTVRTSLVTHHLTSPEPGVFLWTPKLTHAAACTTVDCF